MARLTPATPEAMGTAAAATAGGGEILARPEEQDLPARPAATAGPAAGEARFDELVRLHEPAVRRLAYRLLGWRDAEVDDVVQDVFLALLKHLASLRGEASVKTWLTCVTLNRCRSHRRRQWLRLKWFETHAKTRATEQTGDSRTSDDEAIAVEVRRAVQALKPRDREVIVLFYLEQLPVTEIATLLELRNNAVEVRLHRARQRLKIELAHLMGTD